MLGPLGEQALAVGLPTPPSPLSATGILVYGVGLAVVLLVAPTVYAKLSDDDSGPLTAPDADGAVREDVPTVDLADAFAAVSRPDHAVGTQGPVVELTAAHLDQLTPEEMEWHRRAARLDDEWVTTLRIVEYPDFPTDAYLSELFKLGDVPFDVTVDFTPIGQSEAERALKRVADSLDDSTDFADIREQGHLATRASLAQDTYEMVKSGERLYSQVIYITVRGESRDALRDHVREVRTTLQEDPAECEAWRVDGLQDKALQGACPVGEDPLDRQQYALDRQQYALAGAVGAAVSSPNRPRVLEEGGIEVGIHRDTANPVVVNPFERENGYAGMVVAEPGSGKSFASKREFLWSVGLAEDRIGVIMEPMNNWVGVAEALDATVISVGGDTQINPLEIRKPPARVIQRRGREVDFLKERIQRVLAFLVNFFSVRNVELGDRRRRLEAALRAAYERKGITSDPATFVNESPTMQTVFAVLEDMHTDPDAYVTRVPGEAEKIANDARWLLDQLGPFDEGGQFESLGGHSDFNIRDEDVVYIDIPGQGSVGGMTSLLMQLMVSVVFERAKETSDEVVFPIDEARYIMEVPEVMSMLETFFRHHRHYDLSIRLITQTVGEFLSHDVSKFILEQTAIKQFLRLEEMNPEYAERFGMNPAEMQYVQKALPGSEDRGYSESLVGIDDEWLPVSIEPLAKEQQVIDFDPSEDPITALPGGERLNDLSASTDRQGWAPDLDGPESTPDPGGSVPPGDAGEGSAEAAGDTATRSSSPTSQGASSATSSGADRSSPAEQSPSSGTSSGGDQSPPEKQSPSSGTSSSGERSPPAEQANEILRTDWVPESKQSVFEHAVAVDRTDLPSEEKELRLQELFVRARLAGLELAASELTHAIEVDRRARGEDSIERGAESDAEGDTRTGPGSAPAGSPDDAGSGQTEEDEPAAAEPTDWLDVEETSSTPDDAGDSSAESPQGSDTSRATSPQRDVAVDGVQVNGYSIPQDALPPAVDYVAVPPDAYDDGVISPDLEGTGGQTASTTSDPSSSTANAGE